MAASHRRPRKRRLKAEINVVPYIDVMLVLLIIFMVTAPLLNVGVDVNLPQADAKSLEQKRHKPVVVQVYRDGRLALTYEGVDRPQVMEAPQLVAKVRAFVAADPGLAVYVAGDREVSYQRVYEVLSLLQQQANVARAGLMGDPKRQ
ncbi:MAG: protein TolR [Thermomonas hydrothermalis]|uniref:protein TolR n=1 Tax=Thermomonas hydrothermalis TaxID=213588 RepID=UPI002356DF39|nr:protein TolR [Thermomonas hydrothermalis]MCL6618236.1 protein TolR [Thermomonas hydrothermalis]